MATIMGVGKYEHMEESSYDLTEALSLHLRRWLRKALSKDSRYPSQDLNCAAPEYKPDILPPEPTGLVKFI
jgi:hypothetical protein